MLEFSDFFMWKNILPATLWLYRETRDSWQDKSFFLVSSDE